MTSFASYIYYGKIHFLNNVIDIETKMFLSQLYKTLMQLSGIFDWKGIYARHFYLLFISLLLVKELQRDGGLGSH